MLLERLGTGPVWALGAMSGTSLDGVDAAMVLTDGIRVLEFGESAYRPYTASERAVLAAAMGRWESHGEAAGVVEAAHADLLAPIAGAGLIAFHGQTTAHEPGGRGTCQIGDGHRLARLLGRPVVWDFRSADVAAGGQGAPLAPFYHHALARRLRLAEPAAVLNLGGVGNITLVDPRIADPSAPGACLAFDTGPANAPLDDLMRHRLGRERDEGGALAARGKADEAVLDAFAADPFFRAPPPKSLDRAAFARLGAAVARLPDADAAATLTAAVAVSVALALDICPMRPARLLVTGGGRRNGAMMSMLAERTGIEVRPVDDLGLDGDMLEAQAFAYLAVRVLRGWPTSAPGTTGVPSAVSGGLVSDPSGAAPRPRPAPWPG